ncbi:MAG: enoyl-CoA hydratase/isomerase family protein [Gammaproteobacteria bacterium]|nr:enoyl-CoA hydratase/isomerase family protein [Gammaproteobacteria bacterium]
MTTAQHFTLPKTKDLVLELKGSVLRIWFNRPQTRNALSAAMAEEFELVLDAIRQERSIRTIVLRGKGGMFCAGGDIKGFKALMQSGVDAAAVAQENRAFGDLMSKVNEQPQVVVMLLEGAAIGGGLGLACVGDITIATRDTRFRLSETSLGIPPAQIAPFVTERVGLTAARRLMLTGAKFKGEEAVALGIAHMLARDGEHLEELCQQVLEQIQLCAPGANATTKAIIFAALHGPRADALDYAALKFAQCLLSDEGREGVAAFVEKRPPGWVSDTR